LEIEEQGDLKRCEECGKLFRGIPERKACLACSGEAVEPEVALPVIDDPLAPMSNKRLAALMALYDAQSEGVHSGLIPPGYGDLINPSLAAEAPFETEGECAVCGKPRLKASDLCLDCQARLYNNIGEAVRDVQGRIDHKPPAADPATGVRARLSALETEHEPAYNMRVNPRPLGRIRPQ
jgi:hypothetical protein